MAVALGEARFIRAADTPGAAAAAFDPRAALSVVTVTVRIGSLKSAPDRTSHAAMVAAR